MRDIDKSKQELIHELQLLRQENSDLKKSKNFSNHNDSPPDIQALIDALPFYSMIIDEDHNIHMANNAVNKDLGVDPKEIIGKYCPKVIHNCDCPVEECPLEESVLKGHLIEKEYYDSTCNRWLSSAIYPMKPQVNTPKKLFVHIVHDITDKMNFQNSNIENIKRLEQLLEAGINTLINIVEQKDPYTSGHQQRVSKLAVAIAIEMNLTEDKVEGLKVAAQLHDIGKITIPIEILSKPGQLSPEEFNLIKTHSLKGYEILKNIEFPWPVADMVFQHHERINGSGYPSGLHGKDISLEAKILSVADVVEAMNSHRPYRPSIGIEKALNEININKNILYDEEIVNVCIKLFNEKNFVFE